MAGGIGEFSVSAGKAPERRDAQASAPGTAPRQAGPIPADAYSHYIILAPREWAQSGPLRFHNGHLDEIKNSFRLSAKVPLPDMHGFFPAGTEGEIILQGKDLLHPGSALRDQPLFSHLEALRALVQRCAERKVAFPEFVAALNKIPIQPAWRNDIVNGLFDTAPNAPALPAALARKDDGLDRVLQMMEIPGAAPVPNPGLARFLEEVGRDSTGFSLRESAARELAKDLASALQSLRLDLLKTPALTDALAFNASLNRLARLAKGREKQEVHLWSTLPSDPAAILAGDKMGDIRDIAQALVLLDAPRRDDAYLTAVSLLASRLGCPLLVQSASDEIPAESAPLRDGPAASYTYFFAGGVAALSEGDACVFRPAALAFLEGLVAARESAEGYRDKAMVLEDQDVITEKGQARSSDKLLDNAAADVLRAKGINRVNGIRNRNVAVFPPLLPGSR